MTKLADARINSFGPMPEAGVPSEDPILEIPQSELEWLLNSLLETHNELAAVVKDAGVLKGRELAKVTEDHTRTVRAEKSLIGKMHLVAAYTRQHLNRIRDFLKGRRAGEGGKVVQVVSKIAARAIQLIEHVRVLGSSQSKTVSLDSSQARILIAGKEGEKPSRRDTIRAMRRAERIWPALECDHRPGDRRQTMRITAMKEDIADAPEIDYSSLWQRSGKSAGVSL